MHFVLAGFHQSDHTRLYYFDAIEERQDRKQVTVSADIDLARKYGIALQELPLLCRRLLEEHPNVTSIKFTEAEMVLCIGKRAAASPAVEHRPMRKRPFSKPSGQAWRGLPTGQTK